MALLASKIAPNLPAAILLAAGIEEIEIPASLAKRVKSISSNELELVNRYISNTKKPKKPSQGDSDEIKQSYLEWLRGRNLYHENFAPKIIKTKNASQLACAYALAKQFKGTDEILRTIANRDEEMAVLIELMGEPKENHSTELTFEEEIALLENSFDDK